MTSEERSEYIRKVDKAGMVAQTRELCEAFLRDFPENGEVWFRLASTLITLHVYAGAEAALAKAAEFSKGKVQLAHTHAMHGHLFRAMGDFQAAREWYWKAHKLCPGNAGFLISCGDVASSQGDLARALDLYTRASECRGDDIDEAHFERGWVLLAMRRYGDAAEAYRAALAIDPLRKIYLKRLSEVEGLLG